MKTQNSVFTKSEKKEFVNFLGDYENNRLKYKNLIFAKIGKEIINAEDTKGIKKSLFLEIFDLPEDHKVSTSGYCKATIDSVLADAVAKGDFEQASTSAYRLIACGGKWAEYKKDHVDEKAVIAIAKKGKSFFKTVADQRYSLLANIVDEIRKENLPADQSGKGDKGRSFSDELEFVKKSLTNKSEKEKERKAQMLIELEEFYKVMKSRISSL